MPKYTTQNLTTATLKDLFWLSGKWLGEMDGFTIEEQWSQPAGTSIIGMFRMFNSEAVKFYEFLAFEIEPQGLVLRIKHFSPKLKGWEEKDQTTELWLVAVKKNEALFYKPQSSPSKWLIYKRLNENELLAYFDQEDWEKPSEPYHFVRNEK
jgi:hypothetical protein